MRGVSGKYAGSMGEVCREYDVSMADDSIMKGIFMPEPCRQYAIRRVRVFLTIKSVIQRMPNQTAQNPPDNFLKVWNFQKVADAGEIDCTQQDQGAESGNG